ncbi:hypothetical protein BpHYR1_028536 [Brachionus plicatilis]|uniref:Uncharacterized protein n=1 Tax=Brachionus plicatilis TaxID=10195 RepID=A0A3M7Q1R9_BRAPC|nr:hypothetical protein BpHYR1_028536 [Brachionus plicatilis]
METETNNIEFQCGIPQKYSAIRIPRFRDNLLRNWCDWKELPKPYGLTRLARVAMPNQSGIFGEIERNNEFFQKQLLDMICQF